MNNSLRSTARYLTSEVGWLCRLPEHLLIEHIKIRLFLSVLNSFLHFYHCLVCYTAFAERRWSQGEDNQPTTKVSWLVIHYLLLVIESITITHLESRKLYLRVFSTGWRYYTPRDQVAVANSFGRWIGTTTACICWYSELIALWHELCLQLSNQV